MLILFMGASWIFHEFNPWNNKFDIGELLLTNIPSKTQFGIKDLVKILFGTFIQVLLLYRLICL